MPLYRGCEGERLSKRFINLLKVESKGKNVLSFIFALQPELILL